MTSLAATNPIFDLEKFELSVVADDVSAAMSQFLSLIEIFSRQDGRGIGELVHAERTEHPDNTHLLTRLCAALGQLMLHDDYSPGIPDVDTLMRWQVFLSRLYFLTPFGSMDHLLLLLATPDENGQISSARMLKIYLLLSSESRLTSRLAGVLRQNANLHLATCLMLVWGCTGSEASGMNREWAYQELDVLFATHGDLQLPLSLIHGYFMHSSYGFAPTKHNLKGAINKILGKHLQGQYGQLLAQLQMRRQAEPHTAESGKPVMLVILELFTPQHPAYRVLGKSLLACKAAFTLVAVSWPGSTGKFPDDFFDFHHTLSGTQPDYCAEELIALARQYAPVAIYYPSLGMAPWTIYYSNLRLAPVQFCAIGHGASSYAMEIDYFLIEGDYAGDAATYSEKLVKLPPGATPFYSPEGVEYRPHNAPTSASQGPLNIACCGSFMKINWRFLELCKRLDGRQREQSGHRPLAFHFFLGGSGPGLNGEVYRKLIRTYLPEAAIHFTQSFQSYLDKLAEMDISLSPFPFGGMNGVMDCARLGVVSVCMEGPQVHEAFDAGMWRRMGMPEWLIGSSEDEYEAAAVRIIENPALLRELNRTLVEGGKWGGFFNGDPSVFVEEIERLCAKSMII
jgi:hypothetical protein